MTATHRQFSIEYFPPRTPDTQEELQRVHEGFLQLAPDYFSVTYGAGGSTRSGTVETVLQLARTGAEVAPHLSFGTDSQAAIRKLLDRYREAGITRLVALRGDLPASDGPRYASELVAFIRQHYQNQFHIEVAAYPEVHPDAISIAMDLSYFKQKVNAGADAAITQFFYNPDAYFRFVDETRRLGLELPIVPGIMPITSHAHLLRIAEKCGAEVPRWLRYRLAQLADDQTALLEFGKDFLTDLCQRLLAGGAPGLHFYCLNRLEPTRSIWQNLLSR